MIDTSVVHSQAFGCWLYIQTGYTGWFFGRYCPFGLRLKVAPGFPVGSRFELAFRRFKYIKTMPATAEKEWK
jgi:hypothetical protein